MKNLSILRRGLAAAQALRGLGKTPGVRAVGSAMPKPIVLLIALAAAAANSAYSQETVTLEVSAYKIADRVVGAGGRIPKGTVLTPVVIQTIDPDSGPLPTGAYVDPTSLNLGEALTITVDGQAIASSFPGSRPVTLTTSNGTFGATVFAVGSHSYVIPRRLAVIAPGAATLTVSATASKVTGGISAIDFGLLPAGAVPMSAVTLVETLSGTTPISIATGTATLYDGDGVRGTNPGEEWLYFSPVRHSDAIVTVAFSDGSIAAIRAIQRTTYSGYGIGSRSTLFETAGLNGRSIGEITAVLSSVPTVHGLEWSELGFTF